MTSVIGHRGPDDEGFLSKDGVTMGFRRLSILDLSPHGHQPMQAVTEDVSIVFNGEIYNYVELRSELVSRGWKFKSSGDTEVLLTAYLEWGEACLSHLNGMWAFVIHDRRVNRVFAARDRFGMKPLYYFRDGAATVLASEIKSIRASGLYRFGLNMNTTAAYLLKGELDEEHTTFYAGIEQLPAGHSLVLDSGGNFKVSKYWHIEERLTHEQTEPIEEFRSLFDESIRIHMRSDVPVGVNLSGGLDSTSIICALERMRTRDGTSYPLYAFSFMAPEYDESPYIRETLQQTGATLVPLETNAAQVWADLPLVLAAQDEPVHSLTAVIGYQLMALAASHGVKVILNGQGADETIGGYPNYFREAWSTHLSEGNLRQALRDVIGFARGFEKSATPLLINLLRHHYQSRMKLVARRVLPDWAMPRRRGSNPAWLHVDLKRKLTQKYAAPSLNLSQVLMKSVERSPLPLYLRVEDRNAMAHSIEARLPFLDVRLISFLFRLPTSWKLQGPWNKFILREAMKGRIPDLVRLRKDKMGFPTPAAKWFRKELYRPLRDVLGSLPTGSDEILVRDQLLQCLEQHRLGVEDHTHALFAAAQFHIWRQQIERGG